MASESFLRPFGGLDPGVSRHERCWMGVHVVCTESHWDIVRWFMTCEATGESVWPRSLSFGPSADWMRM